MSASSTDRPATRPVVASAARGATTEAPDVDEVADVGPLHAPLGTTRDDTGGRRARVWAWVAVTKPRIIELLLVTTVPTMVVAAGGWPGWALVVNTVVGGALSAGGANAINNWWDRDIDARMARTSQRPTANGTIDPGQALGLGVVLGILGFAYLALAVNLAAAALATFGLLFYVFVYTMLLKRRTPQAVVIGGIAGCMPVLTGWAATGVGFDDPRPWLLFGILFWWQPPHFWALAMKYREDYARADLPMMPVSWGNDETTRQILLNSWLLAALVLAYVGGAPAGPWFTVPAVLLTAGWLVLAHRLRALRTVTAAMRLFHYSTVFLALVFVAAAVDAVA